MCVISGGAVDSDGRSGCAQSAINIKMRLPDLEHPARNIVESLAGAMTTSPKVKDIWPPCV